MEDFPELKPTHYAGGSGPRRSTIMEVKTTMNDAEMRSRLTVLGLSLKQLSTITGWDYRELRRTANGVRAVSPRTIAMIEQLEAMANDDLASMITSVDEGRPVVIPHFSDEGTKPYFGDDGVMPGSYWHALAGAVLTADGCENACVVYPETQTDDRQVVL